jgi:hypothetical protein
MLKQRKGELFLSLLEIRCTSFPALGYGELQVLRPMESRIYTSKASHPSSQVFKFLLISPTTSFPVSPAYRQPFMGVLASTIMSLLPQSIPFPHWFCFPGNPD